MANFKTHLSFGVILGMASVALAASYSVTTDEILMSLGFIFVVIGSLLPDLDSDEGIPLRIVLHVFALLCSLVAFLFTRQENPGDTITQLFTMMAVYGLVRYALGYVLKKFTHHRGMFHSLPAMLLAFLAGLMILENFELNPLEKLLVAGSLAAGYLGHLVLDEVKAATSFSGRRLRPTRFFGNALKLASKSKTANITVYSLLAAAIYLNLPLLKYYYYFFQGVYHQILKIG